MKTEQLNQLADKLLAMSDEDFILYEHKLQDLKKGDDFYIRLAWYISGEASHKNAEYLVGGIDGFTMNDVNIVIGRIVDTHHRILSLKLLDNHGRYDEDHVDIINYNIQQLKLWKSYETKCEKAIAYLGYVLLK